MKLTLLTLIVIIISVLQGNGWRTTKLSDQIVKSVHQLHAHDHHHRPHDLQQSPLSSHHHAREDITRKIAVLGTILSSTLLGVSSAQAEDDSSEPSTVLYIDKTSYRYSLYIPAEWNVIEKLPLPRLNLGKYMLETVLVSGTCFTEGTSFSVTETDARQLLKDLNIEWWFAPFDSIIDLGTAQLIAQALIVQRQGTFDMTNLIGSLEQATFVNTDENPKSAYLEFDYYTPVAEAVSRRTISKSYLKDGKLYTIWISGLMSAFDSDYAEKLFEIRRSFRTL